MEGDWPYVNHCSSKVIGTQGFTVLFYFCLQLNFPVIKNTKVLWRRKCVYICKQICQNSRHTYHWWQEMCVTIFPFHALKPVKNWQYSKQLSVKPILLDTRRPPPAPPPPFNFPVGIKTRSSKQDTLNKHSLSVQQLCTFKQKHLIVKSGPFPRKPCFHFTM